MVCQTNLNNKLFRKFMGLRRNSIYKEVDSFKDVLGKHTNFLDNNKTELSELMDKVENIISSQSLEERKALMTKVQEGIGVNLKNEHYLRGELGAQSKLLGSFLKKQGVDNETVEVIEKIHKLFTSNGYDANLMFRTLNPKSHFRAIGNDINGSLKYEYITQFKTSSNDKLRDLIAKSTEGILNPVQAERFTKDMLGDAISSSKIYKHISALKGVYRTLKYTVGIVGGTVLLANSALLGTIMYRSKRKGLESLMENISFQKLISQEDGGMRWLASENRAEAISLTQHSIDGNNRYNSVMDTVINKMPIGKKGRQISEAILKGGIHSIRDIASASYVRKLSVAQALAKHGIGVHNIDEFVKGIGKKGDGIVNQAVINRIKADAQLINTDFYTAASLTGLNRNRFSRRWMFNTLQGYTINRTDEIISSVVKLANDLKTGKVRTMGGFVDYVNTENQEMKALLNNVLMAAKMGYYVDVITNDKEDTKQNFTRYAIDTSDYLSALPATFFMRTLLAPFRGAKEYYEYTAATGKKEKFIEGVEVGVLKSISELMRGFFREGDVLQALTDTLVAFSKTGDLDYTADVAGASFDKVVNGLGRFMMVPGLETYDMNAIPQADDLYNQITLNYLDGNESMKKSFDLRNMADVDTFLNNKTNWFWKMVKELPVIGPLMSGASGHGGMGLNGGKYKMFKDLIETDKNLIELWNGNITDEMLSNDKTVTKLYSDLTAFNYPRMAYDKDGKHEQTYGKNPMKEEVFIENIAKGLHMTIKEFDEFLLGGSGGDVNKLGLMKVIAAAEANEPGSSKIVISYLANKDAANQGTFKLGRTASSKADMKREVVKKRYPLMYFADKSSRYKLGQEYLENTHPDVFKGLSYDDNLNGFLNSLMFTDLLMWDSMKKGDIDAKYIKNIFNIIPKYVSSPEGRIAVANSTLDSITSLTEASQDQKQAMKVGVLSANIDIYDEIKKDKVNSVLHEDILNKFEDIVRGTVEDLNHAGGTWAINDLGTGGHKQYYGATGKDWTPNKYSKGNAQVKDDFLKKFDEVFKPKENVRPQRTPYTSTALHRRKNTLSPKEYKLYVKIYEELFKKISENLVKVKGRRSAGELLNDLKQTGRRFAKQTVKPVTAKRIKGPRRRKLSTSVSPGLPGG